MSARESEQSASLRPAVPWWLVSFGKKIETGSRAQLHLFGDPDKKLPASARADSCEVIFDGALYNRAELRERVGPRSTANDAEVVLSAFRRWGEGALQKIKGIFALIVWDGTRDTLWCARDPLGVYALFYADAGCELLLSTSIDALIRHPSVSNAVNRAALAAHLCHRWPKVEETYFAAVKRVPPGHVIRVDSAVEKVSRYWDVAPPGTAVKWIPDDELERFDGLMSQAVNRCQEMGRPGIYLSGGLDSVSIATEAVDYSRAHGLPIPWALSLVFPEPACNEEAVQRSVATDLGLPQVLRRFNDASGPSGVLPSALEMSRTWPSPLVHPFNPAYFNLGLEGKRRGCEVILTGSGGDEWLALSPFYAADCLRALDVANLCRLAGIMQRSYGGSPLMTMRRILWRWGARPLLRAAAIGILQRVAPDALRAHRRRRIGQATPAWVAPDPSLQRELSRRAEESIQASIDDPASDGFYVHDIRGFRDSFLLAMEFEQEFENGRRMGIPVLQPFWDADLVDFLFRTPPHLLSRGGFTKGLVRHKLARRFPKLGFERQKKVLMNTFYRDILLAEGPNAWQTNGGAPALAALGIVDASGLSDTMAAIFAGTQQSQLYRVWDVLDLEAWLKPRG